MRASDFVLEGDVIDRQQFFKDRQARSLDWRSRKLAGMGADAEQLFQTQKYLERWVAEEIEKIRRISDSEMGTRARIQLASILKNYPNTSMIQALAYAVDDEEIDSKDRYLARRFVIQNRDRLLNIIDQQQQAMANLIAKVAEKKWPTGAGSWNTYTRLPYLRRDLEDIRRQIKTGGTSL